MINLELMGRLVVEVKNLRAFVAAVAVVFLAVYDIVETDFAANIIKQLFFIFNNSQPKLTE